MEEKREGGREGGRERCDEEADGDMTLSCYYPSLPQHKRTAYYT